MPCDTLIKKATEISNEPTSGAKVGKRSIASNTTSTKTNFQPVKQSRNAWIMVGFPVHDLWVAIVVVVLLVNTIMFSDTVQMLYTMLFRYAVSVMVRFTTKTNNA